MPVAAFSPSQLHIDYSEWTAPGIAYNGQVWAWNNSTGKYEPTALAFDPAGTASAAVAAHVALSDPHGQYALESALGTAAYLNVGTGANNIVQLNGSGQLPAVSGALLTNLPAGSAAGSTTQVQYNSAGSFAGDAGMTYDAANDRLTVAGGLVAPSMRPASNSTTALQLQNASGTAVLTVDTTNSRILLYSSGATKQADLYIDTNGIMNYNVPTGGYHSYRVNNAAVLEVDGSQALLYGNVLVSPDNTRDIGRQSASPLRFRSMYLGTSLQVGAAANTAISATVDIAASSTTRASLRIRAGVAPTTPNDGDVWFDGTDFKCRIGGVTKTFTVI